MDATSLLTNTAPPGSMATIPSTLTAPWAICHRSCFGKEDRQIKTAGGTGIRGQDQK